MLRSTMPWQSEGYCMQSANTNTRCRAKIAPKFYISVLPDFVQGIAQPQALGLGFEKAGISSPYSPKQVPVFCTSSGSFAEQGYALGCAGT